MQEIASDLGISKASLYYYFPDKEHLFKAVIEMEQEEFFNSVEKSFGENTDVRVLLNEYIKIRLDFFQTYFNLGRFRQDEFKFIKKTVLKDSLNDFVCRENALIQSALRKGVETGIFRPHDIEETAVLFIEAIKGLRIQLLHHKEYMYIEPEEYQFLEKKMTLLADIFVRGLMV